MTTQQKSRTYLYGHNSQETAYVVSDYPWGFRLRTQIRYWVETKESHGQRTAYQTMNPKTSKWCAPKYSTYSPVVIMFLDENNHVKFTALGTYDKEETVRFWIEKHGENLIEYQKNKIKELIAYDKVMKHVTFIIKPINSIPINLTSKDPEEQKRIDDLIKEEEEREKQNKQTEIDIARAIRYEYHRVTI